MKISDNGLWIKIEDDSHTTINILKSDIGSMVKELIDEKYSPKTPANKLVYDEEGRAFKNGKHVCCSCGEPYVFEHELSCSACMAD